MEFMAASATEETTASPSLDLNDPTEARLADCARRISQLLKSAAVTAHAEAQSSLDDFLGAVYALIRAKQTGFRDRPGRPIAINPVRQRAGKIATGNLKTEGLWIAGFYFNNALFRTAAVYHRMLKVITGGNDYVPALPPRARARYPHWDVKKGKTPVLSAHEARELLDGINISKIVKRAGASIEIPDIVGLRDRALIGVMVYTFARVNAVLQMEVRDYFVQGRRGWVRLHEKGGKEHELPCHHNLERYLDEYIAAADIAGDLDGPLFRTTGRKTGQQQEMWQQDAYRMIQRRSAAVGLKTRIGNHTWRATGITAYLKNGGTLAHAQTMANQSSPRTTKLYDRRQDDISLDEVERIAI